MSAGAAGKRKRSGAFYTPAQAARAIARLALRPVLMRRTDAAELRLLDPACGDGSLLEAAAREVARGGGVSSATAVSRCVVGVDIDGAAVRACRARLRRAGGDGCRPRVRAGDSLERWARSDSGGWDVVLGNPPYLFGENRPRIEPGGFSLARGSWDASWLFLERALDESRADATVAMVMPESVAVRTATAKVRDFALSRAKRVDLVWLGEVFEAGIAPVAWVIRKGRAPMRPEVRAWRLGVRGLERREVPGSFWLGVRAPGLRASKGVGGSSGAYPTGDVALGDIATIQIGEMDGKRSLKRLVRGKVSVCPVLTGESVRGASRQAVATHDLGHAPAKSAERYRAPKVLVVKTGRDLRIGIDLRGLVALQSVYCLHVRPGARAQGWTERRLARALAEPHVSERWIRPHTEGKDVFPQVTVAMLREVRLGPVAGLRSGTKASDRGRSVR